MVGDCFCGDLFCEEFRTFQARCEVFVGDLPLCDPPCNTTGCEIEVRHNVICDRFVCTPYSNASTIGPFVTTTTASPSPPPSPSPSPQRFQIFVLQKLSVFSVPVVLLHHNPHFLFTVPDRFQIISLLMTIHDTKSLSVSLFFTVRFVNAFLVPWLKVTSCAGRAGWFEKQNPFVDPPCIACLS